MRAKARLALFAVLVVGAVGAVVPTPAGAFESYYSCSLKPAWQWCDGRANGTFDGLHSWDYNEGWITGIWDNTVYVCQHLWRPSNGTELSGETCGYNWTAAYYGNVTCICYEAEAKHSSSVPRTIGGYADASF